MCSRYRQRAVEKKIALQRGRPRNRNRHNTEIHSVTNFPDTLLQ